MALPAVANDVTWDEVKGISFPEIKYSQFCEEPAQYHDKIVSIAADDYGRVSNQVKEATYVANMLVETCSHPQFGESDNFCQALDQAPKKLRENMSVICNMNVTEVVRMIYVNSL
ncbi:hypothetical protein [Conservatibacter flavescens]|nr:hypothetical protein [Conservatibacter flavescens]